MYSEVLVVMDLGCGRLIIDGKVEVRRIFELALNIISFY